MFADKPGFIAGQMLLALIPDPLRWPVGGADADSGKAGFELALRPGPPAHRLVACRFFRTFDQATASVCGTCG